MISRHSPSLALLWCLGVLCSACSKDEDTPAPRAAGRPLPVTRDAELSRVDSLDAFRTAYLRAYQLKPDARVTLALANLETLLTGKPSAPVETRFQDGRWTFLSNGQELGSLPEFPSHAQALALLETRVRQLGTSGLALQKDDAALATAPAPSVAEKKPTRGKSSKDPSRKVRREKKKNKKAPLVTANMPAPASAPLPLGLGTLQALHTLDQDWATGKRSALRVKEGARALAALSFQLVDLTETADRVPARALAHLALARVVTGEPLTEEQLLLAASLGHAREARELAQTLPAGAPLRLYFLHDDAQLEALARSEREPGLAHYLWVRRLPEVGTSERARRLSRLQDAPIPNLHELTTRLRVRDFEADLGLGLATPVLILSEAAASAGHPDMDERVRGKRPTGQREREQALKRKLQRLVARFNLTQRGLLPAFEQELARVGTPEGFFLDAATERTWFHGLFFSSQYRLGLHLLDSRASPEAASGYMKNLGSADSPSGKEFLDWMSRLIAAKQGQQVEASLMQALTELESFGAAPLLRVVEELQDAADWGDPALSTMTRRLAARMDTRPVHRFELGWLAREALADVGLAEKHQRAALEATGDPQLEGWLAWLDRDMTKLEALLDSSSPDVRGSVRLTALEHLLAEKKVEPAALMGKLRPVLATSGDDWGFISRCVNLLETYERYGEARGLLEKWLEARQGSKAFEMVFARTALARLHQAEGNAAAAWNAVWPAVESWQWDAMRRAALLSLELGRPAQALELAQAASGRYPGSKSLSLLAEVHWRAGRAEKAAEALAQPKRPVRLMDWRWRIGERFAAVFASRPVEEGLKAFQALQEKQIGATELSQLAVEVNKAGNPALAFEMQSRLRAPGLQQLEFFMGAHGYMKQLKGEPAALDWLRATVPEGMREPLSMFAFADREDAVLWEVIPLADGTEETTDYVWLMRAAASLRAHDTAEAHQRALSQRFSVDRPGFYHQLGRHLLGLLPEEAAIAAAATPKSQQELPFFLGLKAQAEGRHEDAVTWYRDCVETGNPRNGEYRWAMNELHRLKQAELSLALLKQRAL
ncbi:tetratricopeptide repeat protein [Cystobacter ferrugineus]|uniref:Tetratricopeptide repeat protein n=1 Tax=Cystobacter ferrugineus TaxID=83449 RepID=A0A1L9B8P0_9BACT|nr:tetratricopeptide repeat protein [Cystobacter ferrugineus]OJH38630.1 hypothetical protein BON30_20535 [Cystobacter ferrugineus]